MSFFFSSEKFHSFDMPKSWKKTGLSSFISWKNVKMRKTMIFFKEQSIPMHLKPIPL